MAIDNPQQHNNTYELTLKEIQSRISGPVPLAVQIRQVLNDNGFKFTDDGKCSSIVNENPEPLGNLSWWGDVESGTVFYKQTLD